jgi:hypothetical protein
MLFNALGVGHCGDWPETGVVLRTTRGRMYHCNRITSGRSRGELLLHFATYSGVSLAGHGVCNLVTRAWAIDLSMGQTLTLQPP